MDLDSFVVAVFAVALAALLSAGLMSDAWRRDAIQRGFAIHCPTDGKWAWKGECE